MPTRELAAARSLLTKALQQTQASNGKRIATLQLALGELSALDRDSLQMHWEALSRGTSVERVQLHFRLIQAEVQCMACFAKYHPRDGEIHCPHCGSYGAKILSGEEFTLESIEWDDE